MKEWHDSKVLTVDRSVCYNPEVEPREETVLLRASWQAVIDSPGWELTIVLLLVMKSDLEQFPEMFYG